jgi:hypothetical protein
MGTRRHKRPKKPKGLKANRQIKSTMFSMLFSDLKSVIELVNALLGTNYGADTPAEIATLKNVLACGRLNDLAVIIDGVLLVLVEHQSTRNENMAYRMLQYVAEIYNRLVKDNSEYRQKRIPLPRPIFVVLYNGAEEMPARERQRLSDSYPQGTGAFTGLGGLELEVEVLNVNGGRNKERVTACKLLSEYSIFIDALRRHGKTMSHYAAVCKTVDECIERGVLKEFLQKHRKELVNMLVKEWDWDKAIKISREESFEEGMEVGMERGMERERLRNALAMKEKGIDIGTIAECTGLPIDTILNL